MLGDDFCLVMPGSQRPLRITPMQSCWRRLTGDIATMRWAGDWQRHAGRRGTLCRRRSGPRCLR